MAKQKKRADEVALARNLAESRSKIQALIMQGVVEVEAPAGSGLWKVIEKSGQSVGEDAALRLRPDFTDQDVGRGAKKLRGALAALEQISVRDLVALDVGSSTGGFTQVLLEKGAREVVAIDVGTHQLHERLRADPRVKLFEQTHINHVDAAWLKERGLPPVFSLIVADVSFISLTKILDTVCRLAGPDANLLLLIKPQFELDASRLRKGVVKDPADHQRAIEQLRVVVSGRADLNWKQVIPSPIEGTDGNKEFFLWLVAKKV